MEALAEARQQLDSCIKKLTNVSFDKIADQINENHKPKTQVTADDVASILEAAGIKVPMKKATSGGKRVETGETCVYQFQRGEKKGTCCGKSIRIEGRTMCSQHSKHEGVTTPVSSAKKNATKVPHKKQPKLRKDNKKGIWYDPNTQFVFDPNTKEVIGRKTANGTVRELTAGDRELCETREWKYKGQKTEEQTDDEDEFRSGSESEKEEEPSKETKGKGKIKVVEEDMSSDEEPVQKPKSLPDVEDSDTEMSEDE